MTAKPLGRITAILAELDLEVTYAYDDLIFIQHSAFLLQFTEQESTLNIFANIECDPVQADEIIEDLVAYFAQNGFTLTPKGTYTLSQNDDETLKLEFS
jgi:hypothetical protein